MIKSSAAFLSTSPDLPDKRKFVIEKPRVTMAMGNFFSLNAPHSLRKWIFKHSGRRILHYSSRLLSYSLFSDCGFAFFPWDS